MQYRVQHHNLRARYFGLVNSLILLFCGQMVLASDPSEKSISSIRMEALKAQTDDNLDQADTLYTQALSQAEKSGSSMYVIEFLSRLVQIKIKNHKLRDTDALIQQAIKLTQTIKNTPASDSNLTVWLDDMADALYSRGEHSRNIQIKEFCGSRYMTLKFLAADRDFDSKFYGRVCLFTTSLDHQGRYLEAIPILQQLLSYLERTDLGQPKNIAETLFTLGVNYLAAKDSNKADISFSRCLKMKYSAKIDCPHDCHIEREMSISLEQQGRLAEAKTLLKRALGYHSKFIGKWNSYTASDFMVLGSIASHQDNFNEAEQYYQNGLNVFRELSKPKSPWDQNFTAAGEMITFRKLAEIKLKQGNVPLAKSLQLRANKIQTKHPEWDTFPNIDKAEFFVIWGYLPDSIDPIATNLKLSI